MEHTTLNAINVIDLHCDTITECHNRNLSLKNNTLHFSLDRLPEPFRLAQFMAIFMPDNLRGDSAIAYFDAAYKTFVSQMKLYSREISQACNISQISESLEQNRFSAILSVEGGSVLGGMLENVGRIYDLGVRMMTLTWNGENEICGGASTDLGFTAFGRNVVKEMERLKMAIDVSHLSDRGFWELCEFAEAPFIASHSNSRTVCNHRRNLTDEMFLEIARRGGIIGLNYYKSFIREDGGDGSIDDLLRHAHHFLALGGEDSLALGSDFDGADMPGYLDGVDKLPYLAENLEKSGIPAKIVRKILFENADNYFIKIG